MMDGESLKGKCIRIPPDGFVELVDYMGSDTFPANVARVSYDGRKKREDDKLVNFLYYHGHHSPFEFNELVFRVKAPIFVARQWFRHRTASYGELSGRYSELKHGFWYPENLRTKTGEVDSWEFKAFLEKEFEFYQQLINAGVVREQARGVLGTAFYTKFYFKIDLRNLFNFLKLRLDPHAQKEIQLYAAAVARFVEELFPNIWSNFVDNTLNAVTLNATERHIINRLMEKYREIPTEEEIKEEVNKVFEEIGDDSKSKKEGARRKISIVLNGGNTDVYSNWLNLRESIGNFVDGDNC